MSSFLKELVFLTSSALLSQAPPDFGWEVAFLGRSNAGKSSAINALSQRQRLAHTSKMPGRTQLLNFFSLDEDRRVVDLPGYGYAKIPDAIKVRIEALLSNYLQHRRCLAGAIVLMDIRRPLMPADEILLSHLIEADKPVHILLTKGDKLSRSQALLTLQKVRTALQYAPRVSVQVFSSPKKTGVEEALRVIHGWFELETPPPALPSDTRA